MTRNTNSSPPAYPLSDFANDLPNLVSPAE